MSKTDTTKSKSEILFTDMKKKPPKYGDVCLVEYVTVASKKKEHRYYLATYSPVGFKFWRLKEDLRPTNISRWLKVSDLPKIGTKQ